MRVKPLIVYCFSCALTRVRVFSSLQIRSHVKDSATGTTYRIQTTAPCLTDVWLYPGLWNGPNPGLPTAPTVKCSLCRISRVWSLTRRLALTTRTFTRSRSGHWTVALTAVVDSSGYSRSIKYMFSHCCCGHLKYR